MHSGLFDLDCHPQYGSNPRNPSLQCFGYALVFLFGYINHELDESKTYIVLPNVHVTVTSLRNNRKLRDFCTCTEQVHITVLQHLSHHSTLHYAIEEEKDEHPFILFFILFKSMLVGYGKYKSGKKLIT